MPSTCDGSDRDPRALVATVNETMATLKIGRAKTYELLNANELESYLEGSSRKVTWRSIEAYIARRIKEETKRRNHGRAQTEDGNAPI